MSNAGWYPDPYGRHEHRYYDGTRWTEHVADRGRQAIDIVAATATLAPPHSQDRPVALGVGPMSEEVVPCARDPLVAPTAERLRPIPPPPPPPMIGVPGNVAPPPARTEQRAVVALVLAAVSPFLCGFLTAIAGGLAAMAIARDAQTRIRDSGGLLTGEGLANAARVVAIISIVVGVLELVALVVWLLATVVMTVGSSSNSLGLSTP